jgi:Ca2+-binding EF-hand superfamily protein
MIRRLSLTILMLVFLTTAVFAQRGERAPLNAQGMREHPEAGFPGTVEDAVASFTRYYNLFDKDGNGEVPLAQLLEGLSGGAAGEVRTLNRFNGWDKDKDGNISRSEMKAGIERSVLGMIEEQLKADADGDDALTPTEYLLSIPQQMGRPGGTPATNPAPEEKNANGLTARQQMMFDRGDANKDGKIARAEILNAQARRASNAYLAMAIIAHAKVCDVNGDGKFDAQEFGLLYGVKPGDKLPAEAEQRFKGRGSERTHLTPQDLWIMFHHDGKADLDAMDKHISEFEKARQAPSTASTSDAAMTKPEDAAAAFTAFFATIDRDRDGKVTVNELLEAHNAEASDSKTLTRLTAWDSNKDGFVTQAEGEAGVIAYVLDQVEQQLKADGDSNGTLSLVEFALAVPDPNGEKLAGSDVTKRQELMFRSADTDKNNQYTRAEAIASMSRRSQYGYIGRRVAYRARIFDLNQDRKYDLNEFALIYGAKPGEAIPSAILEKHNSKSFGAGNHTYYNVMMRLIHAPQTELQEIDARLTAYEKHHATAETSSHVKPAPKE